MCKGGREEKHWGASPKGVSRRLYSRDRRRGKPRKPSSNPSGRKKQRKGGDLPAGHQKSCDGRTAGRCQEGLQWDRGISPLRQKGHWRSRLTTSPRTRHTWNLPRSPAAPARVASKVGYGEKTSLDKTAKGKEKKMGGRQTTRCREGWGGRDSMRRQGRHPYRHVKKKRTGL